MSATLNDLTPPAALQARMRPDLERSEQRHQGVAVLVVKDPVTRRYFRFTQAQAAIIELMDEPIDAESLAAAASERLGRTVAPASVEAFFKSLEQKLLLDTPQVHELLEVMRGQKRKDRNFLYWQLASIDPERAFAWLIPRTRWAFRPAFHVLGVTAILCGFAILFSNWDRLAAAAPKLLSVYGLALVFPVVFSVITIHEFSHGLTCCHFGGKVHEIGFMLIYFQPAFYCDVSDSWLFPSRRNRMWVTFAGGYAQFIVWGLCAIVWRITDPDTLINHVTMIVLVYSGVQSLVNFNPLIKLDGYYMLSDYLEIPNLRAKAAKAVWSRVAGTARAGSESRREIRAQLIYGVLAIIFSTSLLLYVYSSLLTWATTRYRLAGLIGFTMFSAYTLRKTASESISGIRAFATRASLKKWRNLLIAAGIVLISLVGRMELKVPAQFRIIAQNELGVNAETDGIVFEILVKEGDPVKAGDPLARMRDFEKQQKVTDIVGQIDAGKRQLELLVEGPRKEDIEGKKRQIETKNVELANARHNTEERDRQEQILAGKRLELEKEVAEANRQRQLWNNGLTSRESLERAENAARVRNRDIAATEASIRSIQEKADSEAALIEKQLGELQNDLKTLEKGSRPQEIQRQQAEIRRLEELRDLLDQELAKTEIRSPIDGVVSTPLIAQKLNRRLEAGDEFCRIVDTRRVTAEMSVSEKELADVKLGNTVWMKLRGYPDDDIQGHVDFIAPVAQTVDNQKMVVVRSEITNENHLLKPEMTGVAKIYCGERRIAELATRRLWKWVYINLWDLLP
ncbi:MAG TPA: efflux RND transporter periplasmic adaptor subunit [Terriglobia bacterium]|nr:efflux RND transporter periplasmic adaptor subunit [Terriglobia bacterium]